MSTHSSAWAVSDISEYSAQVVVRPDLGVVSRRAAVGHVLSLFQPGRVVALALASDEGAV
jgi:hypothetical protein